MIELTDASKARVILGLNAYHGDASAVVLVDGRVAAAVEEERFRRVKHWAGFPSQAAVEALRVARVEPRDINVFAIGRQPRAHLARKALYALRHRPAPSLLRNRIRNQARVRDIAKPIAETLSLPLDHVRPRVRFVEHHPAHLASAFHCSPFDAAAVCAIDGFGDFVSTSRAVGRGTQLQVLERTHFPHSLGMLYLAITQFLGFPKYGDEYKVMGLGAYGKPDHVAEIRQLLRLLPRGQFALALPFFRHHRDGMAMTWDDGYPTLGTAFTPALEDLLGPARRPDDKVDPRHESIAASVQAVFEEAAFHVLNDLYERTGMADLCLAGGCAMNSVANGKIRANTPFRRVYIQPAAGDNGTSLGAALYVQHHELGHARTGPMEHALWGPAYDDAAIAEALQARAVDLEAKACAIRRARDEDELYAWTARQIADGSVVGWFQGRMEWGARALGNRSILADPRRRDMRDVLNLKIKLREKFRPFAPSILEEAVHDYFVDAVPDPFMIQVYPVRAEKRGVIPAVTHVDGTGRLQTVSRASNPRYWNLINAFQQLTGVPVLLNTSFNENEPIVCAPKEALDCFLRTEMDVLVLGDTIVTKPAVQAGARSPSA